jgi:anti-sigma factor RsiW
MKKRDNNSITYLFSEMDPSEEVEFERRLSENENLLIEVESFKKVKARLGDLPMMEPPKEVCDTVYAMAAQRQSGRSTWHRPIFFAAAAVLFAGFTATALINETDSSASGSDSAQASAGTGTVMQSPSSSPGLAPSPLAPAQLTNHSEDAARVTPWIDHNEMIRFSDRIGQTEAASFDSIFRNSYQRLRPVTDTDSFRSMQRQLQLTGSRP